MTYELGPLCMSNINSKLAYRAVERVAGVTVTAACLSNLQKKLQGQSEANQNRVYLGQNESD